MDLRLDGFHSVLQEAGLIKDPFLPPSIFEYMGYHLRSLSKHSSSPKEVMNLRALSGDYSKRMCPA